MQTGHWTCQPLICPKFENYCIKIGQHQQMLLLHDLKSYPEMLIFCDTCSDIMPSPFPSTKNGKWRATISASANTFIYRWFIVRLKLGVVSPEAVFPVPIPVGLYQSAGAGDVCRKRQRVTRCVSVRSLWNMKSRFSNFHTSTWWTLPIQLKYKFAQFSNHRFRLVS